MITKDEITKVHDTPTSKFITFRPDREYDDHGHSNVYIGATTQLNDWLEANPNIEIIRWQATPVGDHNELYITIQYKEN